MTKLCISPRSVLGRNCRHQTGWSVRTRRGSFPLKQTSKAAQTNRTLIGSNELVLPSLEGKTLYVNIASCDEAEDGPDKEQEMTRSLVQGGEFMLMDETNVQGPEHKMIQEMHAEWDQQLCEMQRKFADDMASEMTDVKNDLAHVRELLGVLVRRERCAETKTKLRPEDWTGWSENRTKPMTPNTKPTFRRPLRISRRP